MLHVVAIFTIKTNMPSYLCYVVISCGCNVCNRCKIQNLPHFKFFTFTVIGRSKWIHRISVKLCSLLLVYDKFIFISETETEGRSSDCSTDEQEKFKSLVKRAKQYASEGQVHDALKLNREALGLCYSEKLQHRIKKMEVSIINLCPPSKEGHTVNHLLFAAF